MTKPIIIDLFSGCGGFGLGAELAGFHSKIAVDIDPDLQSAYRQNFPNSQAIISDISLMTSESWRFLIGETEISGVIGGPPCQGFSRIGKNDKKDPRRELMHHFFRTVNIIKPKFFVMENVEGLLDKGNVEGLLDAIETVDSCYTVLKPIIVDASLYGVPTKRKRVMIIGFDSRRMQNITTEDITTTNIPSVTVKQAIADLPAPVEVIKGAEEFGWARYKSGNISNYAKVMRSPPPKGMGCDLAREMMANKMVSGVFETVHTDAVRRRFSETPQGKVESISRYPRLNSNGHCPTLRAGTGKDRGNFQAMRPIHPNEPRVITVREAARLQGFPDWFLFHTAKWHSFRMIGNSVCPLLAKEIFQRIKSKLEEEVKITVSGNKKG